MMKLPYDEHKNQTGPIHPAEDRNNYRSFLPSDFHKTIGLTGDTPQEEDSPEEEASQVEGAFQEEEDTQEAEECHLEDHQEAVGDHRHYPCHNHKHIKENW